MRRIGLVAVIAVAAFVVGGLGLWRTIGSDSGAVPVAPDQQADVFSGTGIVPAGTLADAIVALQSQVRAQPEDFRSYANLGLAYVQEARITADPSFYPKAEGVLQRSIELDDTWNEAAFTGMGALALARHDFDGALSWGERARKVNPYGDNIYGVIGDAQVELGRYPRAFATFQHMIDLKPTLASYARFSYAQELQGRTGLAVTAMRLAVQAAGNAEDAAWATYQLGELSWNAGDVDGAAKQYRRATELDPSYVPSFAGLAKVAWARGDDAGAIRRYRSVIERYPLPEYVIALGDLYASMGQPALAAQQYSLVRAEEKLFQANGVNVDLELALFDVDHGRVADGLAAARAEWERRHSILVADAYAWALYRAGHAREALPYVHRALSLGMRNALLYFHAGMIGRSLGDVAAARRDLTKALAINPHFSILHAQTAGSALRALGGGA